MLPGLPKRDKVIKAEASEISPEMALLREWQAARLRRTHADLLASRRYGPACKFFLSDLYAARDFSRRNQDIEYMYNLATRFIPDILLSLVKDAIEVFYLTEELDIALLEVMQGKLGMKDVITPEMYAEGYRLCDNYDQRVYQIDLLVQIGHKVEVGTRFPGTGLALRLASGPARATGWDELHDFLKRGYHAFKRLGKANTFLETIQRREMHILDRIYANDPRPFSFGED